MRQFYTQHKQLMDKLFFLVTTVLVLYFFLNTIFSYVAPFVFGYLLSLILNPLVRMITKYLKVGRGLGAVLAIVLLFGVVGFISTNIVVRIIEEGKGFLSNLPEVMAYISATMDQVYLRFSHLYDFIPLEWQQMLSDFSAGLINSMTELLGSGIRSGSTNIVTFVPGFLLGFVMCIVSSYFFIKDKKLISESIAGIMPDYIRENYHIIQEGVSGALAGYVKAQLIMMSIVGAICIVGMFILGVPYALFLGIIIAIVDALPVFGSGFFYWPWIIFCLISGDYPLAIGLGVIYISVLLTRQILEPKVLGRQIGIHPLLTLMSIYVGLRVFGVFGIFIGPCLVVIIKAIFEAPIVDPGETEAY